MEHVAFYQMGIHPKACMCISLIELIIIVSDEMGPRS
jgi:hypothetical protein